MIECDRNQETVGVIKHTSNGRLLVLLKIIVHKAKDERRLWQRHWLACHPPYSVGSILCLARSTFPTAASPSNTSLTLLLGFGALTAAESDMAEPKGAMIILFSNRGCSPGGRPYGNTLAFRFQAAQQKIEGTPGGDGWNVGPVTQRIRPPNFDVRITNGPRKRK